jgi:hypothetical protein
MDKDYGNHKLFRCSKRKKNVCHAAFWYYDSNEYARFNPYHTCVSPPMEDLTPDEVATLLLESVFSAPPKPTPKTKAGDKSTGRAVSYNY